MTSANVVIVGGGISGLSTAYFLRQLGIDSILIEKAGRLGGLIKTDVIQGCVLEAGPDSYLAAKPAVTELAQELPDLKDQMIGSNDERRRVFIARAGKLMPLPPGMVMMVPGQWAPALTSSFFGIQTKLRFLAEGFSTPVDRRKDVSVAEFVGDHFGKEVVEYVAEPLLSGVYGGDPAQLSAQSVLPRFLGYERSYGSLIRGVRRERNRVASSKDPLFLSFSGGMQALIDSLGTAVRDLQIVNAQVTRIHRIGNGWRVSAGQDCIEAKQVVLACPAYVCAELIEDVAPPLAMELGAIRHSSAILVNLVYEQAKLRRQFDGFGFLVPRAERKTVAAATWASTKFSTRAPSQLAILRAFIVDPEAKEAFDIPKEKLVESVRADFHRFMNIEIAPLLSTVHAWPNSMPQYEVGHRQRSERIAQLLREPAGLHLTGNAYDGVGLPDCVRLAKETAKRVQAHAAS